MADNQAAGGIGGAGGNGGAGGAAGRGGHGASGLQGAPGANGGAGGNGGNGGRAGAGGTSRGGGLEWAGGSGFGTNATIAYNQAAGGAGGAVAAGGAAGAGGAGGIGVLKPDGANGPDGVAGSSGASGTAGAGSGGGLSAGSTVISLLLANTIVARNTASDVTGIVDPGSTNNVIGTGGAGGLTSGVNGNFVGVADPRMGTLASNGGPTQTIALLFDSPAINAGDNGWAFGPSGPLTTDQRGAGFPRIVGVWVDIGAFEWPYGAESLVVTTLADEDDGFSNPALGAGTSLREAINWANLNPDGDLITFAPALAGGTITLAGTQLPLITDDLTITGLGASNMTISGDNASRVLEIASGADVIVIGVSIINGRASDAGGIGVFSGGNLLLDDVILSGNNASRDGGGIYNAGTLTVTNSTLAGNSAQVDGGGIYNSGKLLLGDAILSNNSSREGGGIYNAGTVTVTNSTLAGNSAVFSGGGISNFDTVTVTNSTLAGNSATFNGGGIRSRSQATLTLTNTIIADNSGNAGTRDFDGTVEAASAYNLIGDAASAGGLVNGVNGNIVGVDPKLGPLADNGGPTQTMALLPGSPAIDAGNPAFDPNDPDGDPTTNDALSHDQRGAPFARVVGARVDIGAYEDHHPRPILSATALPNGIYGAPYSQTLTAAETDYHGVFTFAVTTGALPPGLSLASDGTLSGMPTMSSWLDPFTFTPFTFTVTATDADGYTGSRQYNLAIDRAKVVSSISSPLNPSVVGQPVTFTATLSPVAPSTLPPAGWEIDFWDFLTLLGTATTDAGGQATFTISTLPVGDHPIYVLYGGHFNFDVGGGSSPIYNQTVLSAPVNAGDYNQNGTVDAADYTVWRDSLGTTGVTPYSGADGDGNGSIEQADYAVWRSNFGRTLPNGASGASSMASQESTAAASAEATSNIGSAPATAPNLIQSSGVEQKPLVTLATTASAPSQRDAAPGAGLDLSWLANAAGSPQIRSERHIASTRERVDPLPRDHALLAWYSSYKSNNQLLTEKHSSVRRSNEGAREVDGAEHNALDEIFADLGDVAGVEL